MNTEWSDADARFFTQLVDMFVTPEIRRRAQRGELTRPIRLDRFQVLFWANQPPRVLLNEEVAVLAKLKLRESATRLVDWVTLDEVEDVQSIKPASEPDAAHATMLTLGATVYFVFDFTYNRALASRHLERAREFFESAVADLAADRANAACDALWSAAELAAVAWLLALPDKELLNTRRHDVRRLKFEAHARLNLPGQERTLAQLTELRGRARYVGGGESQIERRVLTECISRVEALLSAAEKRLER